MPSHVYIICQQCPGKERVKVRTGRDEKGQLRRIVDLRRHVARYHPSLMKKWTKKALKTKRKRGLISNRIGKNPSPEWHKEELKAAKMKAYLSGENTREGMFYKGEAYAHERALREEKMKKKNPIKGKYTWHRGLMAKGGGYKITPAGTKILKPWEVLGQLYQQTKSVKYKLAAGYLLDTKSGRLYMKMSGRHLGKNPGAKWHEIERDYYNFTKDNLAPMDRHLRKFYEGKAAAHEDSLIASKRLGMNPRKKYVKIYDNVSQIQAQKGEDSNFPKEKFYHPFKKGAKAYGTPDGDIIITTKKL